MPRAGLLDPAEFPHCPAGVPDLGHVADFAVLELHHVDVVAAGALTGGGQRAALGAVSAREHGVGADVVTLIVGGEGLDHVGSVRDEHEQALHPVGVLLERTYVSERYSLGREARVRMTVGPELGPAFACLAGVEKGSCRIGDGVGGSGHGVASFLSCLLAGAAGLGDRSATSAGRSWLAVRIR